MKAEILAYNNKLEPEEKAICDRLAAEIIAALPKAVYKIWHRHPVWFLNDNPVVGYSKQVKGINLMFWSGQSFGQKDLKALGKFKAAGITYSKVKDIDLSSLKNWLVMAEEIQWDYKNIVKRKGNLVRL